MPHTHLRGLALLFAVAGLIGGGMSAAPSALADPAPSGNLQGDQQSWIKDPHMHAFYALTVSAFAGGPGKVDRPKFERDAMGIFRDFAVSRGMDPQAMQDHLKLIPGQVIQIATDDPKVLASYDNFVSATFGPQ